MNFWGFKPSMFPITKDLFDTYSRENINTPKAEFYIPTVMTHIIKNGLGDCRVFRTSSNWFGVTYPEDKPVVQASLSALHVLGDYPERLWD
jgi:hypothetical protein